MKGSTGHEYAAIGGIELDFQGNDVIVRVEFDGVWKEVIRDGWGEVSPHHTFHANGLVSVFEHRNGIPTEAIGYCHTADEWEGS